MQHSTSQTAPPARALRLPRLVYSPRLWLAILALPYGLGRLALVRAENPAFLIHDIGPYERVLGFAPDPPELAPLHLARDEYSTYNVLWGPVPMLLMASAWWLTHSLVLMGLVVPAAAGVTV